MKKIVIPLIKFINCRPIDVRRTIDNQSSTIEIDVCEAQSLLNLDKSTLNRVRNPRPHRAIDAIVAQPRSNRMRNRRL